MIRTRRSRHEVLLPSLSIDANLVLAAPSPPVPPVRYFRKPFGSRTSLGQPISHAADPR